MITVLAIIGVGFVLGLFFRKNPLIININAKLTTVFLYLLLFYLGVSLGQNHKIIDRLASLSYDVVVITFFSIAGTLIVSSLVNKIFLGKK